MANRLTNINLISRKKYNELADPSKNELWAVETPVVVETYQNDTSWYRVWSDGWCEQGGKLVINSSSVAAGIYSTKSLNFMKPFVKLLSYNCQAKHDRFNTGFADDVVGKACTTVSVYQVNDSSNSFSNPFIIWEAKGYIG